MNTKLIASKFENLGIFLLTFFFSIVALAQTDAPDTKVKVTNTETTTSTEEWFTNPIYWVIGALLFILLIAVIVRSNGKKD
ncbi:hypothetical protein N0B16_09340 [Chryseobacterium sp. GMJ5]|uniref:Uncharacterized protein n=1 Tax=Chryseobacterium gilvum TaxID=2976534 RepID=A0ABT2VXB4_9FLAO|nr:hypothetical protein [Chryseobacterium gilvum]MCU7614638.1 hypothetical protein [Chryseobacterium gilvum]